MTTASPIPSTSATSERPIAGIVVASVLGVINLIWSGVMIIRDLTTDPAGPRAELPRLFPALSITGLLGGALGLAGSTVLLIGALLSFARHPAGNRTVRIACYSMLLLLVLLFALMFAIVVGSPRWSSLDPVISGGIIGGIVGGVIGATFQWGLILFLFRKKRCNQ